MKLSYKQQLQDPRWKAKRLEILQRDNHSCTICMSASNLNVHHKTYLKGKKAWEYSNEYLTTLCEDCHAKVHGKYASETKVVKKALEPLNPFVEGRVIPAIRTLSTPLGMDTAPKISLYVSKDIRLEYMKLHEIAFKLLFYFMNISRYNKDIVKLDILKFMKESDIKSRTTVYKGIDELITNGFILKYNKRSYYWINPFRFFHGTRTVKYKNNVSILNKKKTEEK